jgi:hypothetical protein
MKKETKLKPYAGVKSKKDKVTLKEDEKTFGYG